MPSRSRRRRPDTGPPNAFVDRSLGTGYVPAVFRDAGHAVVLTAEMYPGGADQRIGDDRWIAEVSDAGLVALTEDANIVRMHETALRPSTLRVFCLASAGLTDAQMADRFRTHLNRIVQQSRRPGPYVHVLHRDRIERRWHP